MSEQDYIRGSRMAWTMILQQAIKQLGYDGPEANASAWILEREAAVAALRDVCGEHGDNDWEDSLHLADVIEKHLAPHLPDPMPR